MSGAHIPSDRRALPALLAGAVLLAVALAYVGLIGGELLRQAREWPTLHRDRDFPSYYLSARRLLRGEDFYQGLQGEARALGLADYFIDHAVTPPTFVVVTAPLGWLSYPAAWGLWLGLSLGALAASLWLLVRETRPALPLAGWVALGSVALLFPPLGFHLLYSHTELFVLLLLTGAWVLLRRGKQLPAGLLLGLAGAIRLYPLFFLVLLVQRRAWKGLLAALGSGLGLALLAGLAAGPSSYQRYLETLRSDVPVLYPLWGNTSLWGVVHKAAALWPALQRAGLLRDGLAAALSLGLLALTVGLVGLAGRSPRSLDWGYGLYVPAVLLASPLAWIYYQVLLYLPLFLLLQIGRQGRHAAALRTVLLATLAASLLLFLQVIGLPAGMSIALSFALTLPPLGAYVALVLARPRQENRKRVDEGEGLGYNGKCTEPGW